MVEKCRVKILFMNASKILGIVLVLLLLGFTAAFIISRNTQDAISSQDGSTEALMESYVEDSVETVLGDSLVGSVEQTSADVEVPQESNNLNLEREKKMSYTVTLKTTEGDIVIKLNDNETPVAVNNFVKLSKEGFYDGVIFHRVIDDFMIQGGDPKGNGTGGPGYTFDDEPFTGEYVRGTVAMANSGPNTNGSQFFIMHQDYSLPKKYVIFGQVVEGLDVVDKIATAETATGQSRENSTPVNPVVIESVEVLEEESK